MRILFNHLGYRPGPIEGILLEAPENTRWHTLSIISLSSHQPVWTGTPEFSGAVEGWSCGPWWRIQGLSIEQEGRYALRWETDQSQGQSEGFDVAATVQGQGIISDMLFYFKGQRCSGIWDTADQNAPRIDDRQTRDVHGGWYDASGDTSKYLSHLSYTNTMNPQQTPLAVWTLIQTYRIHKQRGAPEFFLERIRDEALHGADFLVRMLDEKGFWYTTVFDTWSKDPDQRELCSYKTQQGHKSADYQAGWRQGGGMAVAALAAATDLGNGQEFSATDYEKSAITGFAHLEDHSLEYLDDGRENLIDHCCALLAAAELTHTGQARPQQIEARLSKLEQLWTDLDGRPWLAMDESHQQSWFHASDAGLPVIALARAAQCLEPLAKRAQDLAVKIILSQCDLTETPNNPFAYPPHWVKVPGEKARIQWFFPHENPSGYWWQGENARIASLASAALAICPHLADPQKQRLQNTAAHWIEWILGRNPFDLCMLQGHGRNNPTYEYGYANAPGGVCNGITSAPDNEGDIAFAPKPWADDSAHTWRWGEQWMPHAAWLILALSLKN